MRPLRPLLAVAVVTAGFGLSACSQGVDVKGGDPVALKGAELFAARCSGCHTLKAAGAQGSGNKRLRPQGPNFNQRKVVYQDALFAIRNGGFTGSIMPQNIVTGMDAEHVARFVGEYSGSAIQRSPVPSQQVGPQGGSSQEIRQAISGAGKVQGPTATDTGSEIISGTANAASGSQTTTSDTTTSGGGK